MTTDIHNLGKFTSLADVWAKYPNGAYTGDYVFINGVRYYWDKYEVQWLTRVDTIDLNIEVFDISTYDFVNNDWRETLPDGKYSVICDDKIIGTLLKAKEGFVLEGFLTLYQGEKQTVKHGDHKVDKSEVIKDITEKTYVYNAEDDTFFFSDGHISNEALLNNITLNKKTQDSFNQSITEKLVQTNANVASNTTAINGVKELVGTSEDAPSPTGSVYARITQNQDDIANNAQDITRLEENLADEAEKINELKDDISSHSDDINTLTNEVNNIKQSRGEADGFASLDSDGKVPLTELPQADSNKPGILKAGQETRIRRNYLGELFMELTADSGSTDVKRAFTPKGESEPRVMQVGDCLSNYGDRYPRNLIVVSTGLDNTQTVENGRLIYLADGSELYKMIVDTAQWKLYMPITVVDKRRIYKPSLMRLSTKSTAEEIQSALTPIGETQPVFPKAGDGVMDGAESVCVITRTTEGDCYIQILDAETMDIIGISADMTKVLSREQQEMVYMEYVVDLTDGIRDSLECKIAEARDGLNEKIGDLATEVSTNTDSITELKATVADHETGLGSLADQIGRIPNNTISRDEGNAMLQRIKTNEEHISTLGNEISSAEKDIKTVKNIAVDNSENIDAIADRLDTDAVSGLTTAQDATKVSIKVAKRNIKTGVTTATDVVLPSATTDKAGVMTADDKRTLSLLENRVTDVETTSSEQSEVIVTLSASLQDVADVDANCFFSLQSNVLFFKNIASADVYFRLFRWTGKRYAEYVLWEGAKKVDYTIFVITSNMLMVRLNAQNVMTLSEFVKGHSTKRKKWGIQAFLSDNDLPQTAMFEFAVAEQIVYDISDLHEQAVEIGRQSLVKRNGHRDTPRRDETRLAYYYDSSLWQTVGDKEFGFQIKPVANQINNNNAKRNMRFPCSGDIVRRTVNNVVVDGNILCVDRKADGSFEMTWNEGKKVYSMVFSKYNYILEGDDTRQTCTGMRIAKAATLICDDITNQTKGGTLRDLYIQAGAKYNEDTGYYELNGLTDITEEEMREIYLRTNNWWNALPNMRGWYDGGKCRTNIPCPSYLRLSYTLPWHLAQAFNGDTKLEVINFNPRTEVASFQNRTLSSIDFFLQGNRSTKKVIGKLVVSSCPAISIGGYALEDISLFGINKNVNLYQATALSKESLLYMINNSTATSAITIFLLQVLYDKYKADTDVLAALEEHPFVSLALKTN